MEVEYSVVHSYGEGTVIFIIDANDGSLESDTAATRPSLHLLLGLDNDDKTGTLTPSYPTSLSEANCGNCCLELLE